MKHTFDEMVETVCRWLEDAPEYARSEFVNTEFDNLIEYHHFLGRDIRNHFALWEVHWTPETINGIDMSPNHPDAISMEVIKEVWRRVQNANNV